jgi:hypothetical protein
MNENENEDDCDWFVLDGDSNQPQPLVVDGSPYDYTFDSQYLDYRQSFYNSNTSIIVDNGLFKSI